MPRALQWADFQARYFQQTNLEGRDDEKSISELRAVIQRVRMLCDWLQQQVPEEGEFIPESLAGQLARAESLLVDLNRTLAEAQARHRIHETRYSLTQFSGRPAVFVLNLF